MCVAHCLIAGRLAHLTGILQIEQNTFEFKDPKVERLAALTPADRRWIDDIVNDVNDGWNEKDPTRPLTMQFKGSDDYLRAKVSDLSSFNLGPHLRGDRASLKTTCAAHYRL